MKSPVFLALLLAFALNGEAVEARANEPKIFLWAWEKPEDLSSIDPHKIGVAVLACHITICDGTVIARWRNQSVKVPPKTTVIPVVRIDVTGRNPVLGETQEKQVLQVLTKAAYDKPSLQIDFDALQDQRPFYASLLKSLRTSLPAQTSISITALASWCLFDSWIKVLPVNETVPMMFSLGRERQRILQYFTTPKDFRVDSCCDSLGLSLEDREVNDLLIPVARNRHSNVRYYVFTRTAWTAKKVQEVLKILPTQ